MTTWLASQDTEGVLAPARDERGLTGDSGKSLPVQPELALTRQENKGLVLAFVDMARRAALGWADAVHNGHRAACL
jgi:hypothetical protein